MYTVHMLYIEYNDNGTAPGHNSFSKRYYCLLYILFLPLSLSLSLSLPPTHTYTHIHKLGTWLTI